MRGFRALAPLLLLAACSTSSTHPAPPADPLDNQTPHINTAEIHADLIQQMMDKGQYYAALAHIEDQERNGTSDQLTLLEADCRSQLGQTALADVLYRKLLKTSYAGPAYHGLGLLYTGTDLDGAIRNFRYAVERTPTDVDFRNDLGYALMLAGRYTEALPELSTAAELAPNQLKSRYNLIELMMLVGDEGRVQQLSQQAAVPPQKMQELRDIVQTIRNKQNARAAKVAH